MYFCLASSTERYNGVNARVITIKPSAATQPTDIRSSLRSKSSLEVKTPVLSCCIVLCIVPYRF